VHPVDPGAGEIRKGREVRLARRPLGLEAAHLADRRRRPIDTLPADNWPHRRIAGERLSVVDVFVAGEPTIDRLSQQSQQMVADVPAAPPLTKRGGHRGQAKGTIQLAVGEQTPSLVIRAPWNSSLMRGRKRP
jgi:hypothetical protein